MGSPPGEANSKGRDGSGNEHVYVSFYRYPKARGWLAGCLPHCYLHDGFLLRPSFPGSLTCGICMEDGEIAPSSEKPEGSQRNKLVHACPNDPHHMVSQAPKDRGSGWQEAVGRRVAGGALEVGLWAMWRSPE